MKCEALVKETLVAFLFALANQKHPSSTLQSQLNEIGGRLQLEPALAETPLCLIKPLMQAHPDLSAAYDAARVKLTIGNGSRWPNKINALEFLPDASASELVEIFKEVMQNSNSIRAIRRKTLPNWLQNSLRFFNG